MHGRVAAVLECLALCQLVCCEYLPSLIDVIVSILYVSIFIIFILLLVMLHVLEDYLHIFIDFSLFLG